MKDAVRDPDELCRLLDLPPEFADAAQRGRATVSAVRAARLSGPHAAGRSRPIRCCGRCCRWPTKCADVPGFVADPVGDAAATRQPGLLQKYDGRVLLDHDRHMRRPLPLLLPPALSVRRVAALARRLAAGARRNRGRRQSIHEVILSGGDPLTLVDATLAALVERVGRNSRTCGGCGFTRGCRS